MDIENDLVDNIKACRTCGIHYVTPTKHQLKHLFQSSQEHSEIMLIRLELSKWNVEVAENDGFPQYVCNTCIHKFDQVFQLRAACINAQNEFRKFYALPNGNVANIKIKTELPDKDGEPPICDFIYVDELSDGEYDGATPFNFPHIPIKSEVIEAATVPMEESEQPINMVESASRIVMQAGSSTSHIHKAVTQNEIVANRQPASAIPIAVDQIECKICRYISSNQVEHKQHMENIHDIKDQECHICGKEFKDSTSARLKFHMKWHTLNKQVKCILCGFMCNSKDALSAHKRANHRKLNCKECGKGVLAKKMKSHLRQHQLLTKYPCVYCAKVFATEDERENHIWQIHANEDNTPSGSIPNIQTSYTQTINDISLNVSVEENVCPDSQEDILYKFICAHCERRFIEQVDLEAHVNEHNVHLANYRTENATLVEDAGIISENIQNEKDGIEQAVFEDYDNENEIQITGNNISSISNPQVLPQDFILPSSSADFVTQSRNVQSDAKELALKPSFDAEPDSAISENEANVNLTTYVESNLNAFACAKCSETFVSIEQLRQHYERHIVAEQQHQQPTVKSKFQCNLCGKLFDLKFRLNRHISKHKDNVTH